MLYVVKHRPVKSTDISNGAGIRKVAGANPVTPTNLKSQRYIASGILN